MRLVSLPGSSRPVVYVRLHCSAVAEVKSSAEGIAEFSVHDVVTEKEFALGLFDPQMYRRDKAWLTTPFSRLTEYRICFALLRKSIRMTTWSL